VRRTFNYPFFPTFTHTLKRRLVRSISIRLQTGESPVTRVKSQDGGTRSRSWRGGAEAGTGIAERLRRRIIDRKETSVFHDFGRDPFMPRIGNLRLRM
jgi:hypothetical protein